MEGRRRRGGGGGVHIDDVVLENGSWWACRVAGLDN